MISHHCIAATLVLCATNFAFASRSRYCYRAVSLAAEEHKPRSATASGGSQPSSSASFGADDLLPHLSYVILCANVPYLQSNLDYIAAYRKPEAIDCGEEGYYVVSFVTSVAFLVNWAHTLLPRADDATDADAPVHFNDDETVERQHIRTLLQLADGDTDVADSEWALC